MGQEMSCTSRGKFPQSFDEGFDRFVDGVEGAAEVIEQAVDDSLRAVPAKAQSSLSDKERDAATALFWQLVREQGGAHASGATALVFEDAAMALCLQQLNLVDGDEVDLGVHGLRELVGEPAAESVIRRLHAIPVGRWLKADPGRRGYTSEEWISLIQHLQSPIALVEAPTIPPDNPLPVSALLQIPSRGLLVCGCANDSTLDRVEHMIDGPTSMPSAAASCSKPSSSISAVTHATANAMDAAQVIRPLGALLVWRWPTSPSLAASASPNDVDRALRRAHQAAGGGVIEGSALLQAFTPLATAVQCLAYCESKRLVLVGSRSGAIQLYSLGQRGALHYRYAIEAHASPILSLNLRPHPARLAAAAAAASSTTTAATPLPVKALPPPATAASSSNWTDLDRVVNDDDEFANPSTLTVAASTPPPAAAQPPPVVANDELMISAAEWGDSEWHDLSSCVLAYDLGSQIATPLTAPLDEPVTCVESEEMPSAQRSSSSSSSSSSQQAQSTGGRLFLGTLSGGVVVAYVAIERERPQRKGKSGSSSIRPFAGASARTTGGGDTGDGEAEEPAGLELRALDRKVEGHTAPVCALCHCTSRNVLCSGARDGTIAVWALPARDVKGAATRLLGRLSGPSPLGSIVSLTTLLPPAGGAPRVIAAGADGHVFEWDLRGGRVCRAIHHVPNGLDAVCIDSRFDGQSMWLARGGGVLQLWRWPPIMPHEAALQTAATAEAEAEAEAIAAADDDDEVVTVSAKALENKEKPASPPKPKPPPYKPLPAGGKVTDLFPEEDEILGDDDASDYLLPGSGASGGGGGRATASSPTPSSSTIGAAPSPPTVPIQPEQQAPAWLKEAEVEVRRTSQPARVHSSPDLAAAPSGREPPAFVSIQAALAPVGGLPPPAPQTGPVSGNEPARSPARGNGSARRGLGGGMRGADGHRIEEMVAEPTPQEAAAIAMLNAEEEDPIADFYEGGVQQLMEDAESAMQDVSDVIAEVGDAVTEVGEAIAEATIGDQQVRQLQWGRQPARGF